MTTLLSVLLLTVTLTPLATITIAGLRDHWTHRHE